jgi:hypothetical protein
VAPRRDAHDEARLLPRFRERAKLEAEQARVLRKAVRAAVDERRELRFPAAAGGDPRALRGLPAVGVRGVGGHIAFTRPEQEVLRRSK